jgi:uncharacterized membrane protein YphA (DoxX/SURF4 family)
MVRISFLTCVFLIGLRLVIGWHFFFEGVHKVRTVEQGETDANKPFSSAGYFAEAEGPLGPVVREQIGDPDADALAKLTIVNGSSDKPAEKLPPALAREWDDYARRFIEAYRLDGADKDLVEERLRQAKADYVLWLTDAKPEGKDGKDKKKDDEPRKSRKTITTADVPVSYEVEEKVEQRVLAYKLKVKEIRDVYEFRLPRLGKDVEKAHLRTLKGEAATMRTELMKDVDEQTKAMKEALARVVGARLSGLDLGVPEDPSVDERVAAMLTLRGEGDEATPRRVPEALDHQWTEYIAFVKDHGKPELRKDPDRADAMLDDARLRFVRYLLDRDQYTGEKLDQKEVGPRVAEYLKDAQLLKEAKQRQEENPSLANRAYAAGLAKALSAKRQPFVNQIRLQTDVLRQNLGGFATDLKKASYDNYKGTVETPKEKTRFLWRDWPTTKLEWLDWSTRWVLLVAGGCLLVGLFTRLACLTCIVFLVIEYLSNPPFPWLPVSPKAEGNYLFVNKNIVELLALLVLMTLPTGRWLGLDAILSRIWPFRRRQRDANGARV